MSSWNEWITELPRSWEALPLKAVASYAVSNVDKIPADDELSVRLCNYTDVYKNEFITSDMEFMAATATIAEIEKFHLNVDDVIITKDSESWDDIAIPALVMETEEDIVCGYHLSIIRPNKERMEGRFLFRCLQARPIRLQLELAATGITRFGLAKDEIGKLVLPVPPPESQASIADYLDAETGRIDALVAEKERMLALLEEKRAALISRAVTRGLDPNAPLKPSGLDWIGDIPAHWDVMRLRVLIIALDQGWSPQASNQPAEEGEIGVLKLSAVSRGFFDPHENKALGVEIPYPPELGLKAGDVLVTRANTPSLVGEACAVPSDFRELLISDLIYRLRVRRDVVEPEYLVAFLISAAGKTQIRRDARGSSGSMVKISQEHIKNWALPLPPISEQHFTLDRLSQERRRTSELEASLRRSVNLLRERRSALITAAVTGQIEPEAMRA